MPQRADHVAPVDVRDQVVEHVLAVGRALRLRHAQLEQAREMQHGAVVAEGVGAEAERVRVVQRQPAHRGPAQVRVEDAPLQIRRVREAVVAEGGLGEAHAGGLAVAVVDRHSPARVVVHRLMDQRVRRLQQLMPEADRLSGYAPKYAAHGGENPTLTASQLKDRPRGDVWIHRDESGGLGRESCALWNGRGVAGAVTGPSGANRTSRTWWTAACGWSSARWPPGTGWPTTRPRISSGATCRLRRARRA